MESDFWDNKEKATEVSQEISSLKEEIDRIIFIKKEVKDLKEIQDLGIDDFSEEDLDRKLKEINFLIDREETKTFLSGKYDKNNAILQIFSGAGGQDAQDWAAMIARMYERYLTQKGYSIKVIDESFGEGGGPEGRIGIKEKTIEVKGELAFGKLKGERGVHRLVRLSPFSSKNLRHTSFAMVDVLPEIDNKKNEIELKQEDLKFETCKSSGPGGQNVNKRETAVRIIHLPTGLVATSQSERSQGVNRDKAMSVLVSKLTRIEEEKREKELIKIKGGKVAVEWGSQIRSYVLHPYKMVKDLRTGVETTKAEDVLNGKLDEFIESNIKWFHQKNKLK